MLRIRLLTRPVLPGILIALSLSALNAQGQRRLSPFPDPEPLPDGLPPSLAATIDASDSAAIALAFIEAKTVDEKLAQVRDPDSVAPLLRSFYAGCDPLEKPYARIQMTPAPRFAAAPYHNFHVLFNDLSNRLISVTRTGNGSLKVDFLTYIRHNPTPWSDFLADPPASSLPFRVLVNPSDYYNFEFANEEEFAAFHISSPDLDQPLYAYVVRDSPLHNALMAPFRAIVTARKNNFEKPGRPLPAFRAILSLSATTESLAYKQLTITKFHHFGWVTPSK